MIRLLTLSFLLVACLVTGCARDQESEYPAMNTKHGLSGLSIFIESGQDTFGLEPGFVENEKLVQEFDDLELAFLKDTGVLNDARLIDGWNNDLLLWLGPDSKVIAYASKGANGKWDQGLEDDIVIWGFTFRNGMNQVAEDQKFPLTLP